MFLITIKIQKQVSSKLGQCSGRFIKLRSHKTVDKCVAGRKCALSDIEFDLRKDAEREQFFHESRGRHSLKWKSLAYCRLSEEGFNRAYQEKCSLWWACFEQCICSFEPFSDFFQIKQRWVAEATSARGSKRESPSWLVLDRLDKFSKTLRSCGLSPHFHFNHY